MRREAMPELNLRNKDGQQEMRADGTRLCMSQGCAEDGYYPAPKNRQELRSHIWFCLDHVRAYNSHWNYYDGLEGDALEAEIRRATTWERPSWKFGSGPGFTAEGSLKDPFGFFDGGSAETHAKLKEMDSEEREAWALFDISPDSDPTSVKQRYNELAKQYHPDHNKSDPKAEERFKEINLAYSVLRKKAINLKPTIA